MMQIILLLINFISINSPLSFIQQQSLYKSYIRESRVMSKHSKNNTSSSVFTYQERQKLKSVYGTQHNRVGQDSIKPFEMCNICNNRYIEPTCCDQGHMFCRPCIIEYLVKQKKKIVENQVEIQKFEKRKEHEKQQKKIESELKKMEQFEKYDGFLQITDRSKLINGESINNNQAVIPKEVKPIGIYELNARKSDYVKTAFWTLQNAPSNVQRMEKESTVIYCPASKHKLTLKKLKNIVLKQLDGEYCCWICSKEIKRQKVGIYKCGHLVCQNCKSNKCEICQQSQGWSSIDNGSSAYAAHNRAEVKTYTHAFVG